jgi:hypothetical protein
MPTSEIKTAISTMPAVLNSWDEHCDSIDTRLDDLDGLLHALNVAMTGPMPVDGDAKVACPTGPHPSNFTTLLHKSNDLRSRFESILKQLHAILD